MNSDGELGQPGKRRREEEHTTTTDRLSHLPDPIMYHILSFLDTKSAVRTSKLSRSWSRVWKHVPVLDFRADCFKNAVKFDKFVSRVLSLRYDLKLHKVVYFGRDTSLPKGGGKGKRRSVNVINYALSHDVQHLVLHRNSSTIISDRDFSSIFSEYCNNNGDDNNKKKNNVKTLDLTWITLDQGFAACSGFAMLTTLNLESCYLDTDQGLDLSANFPCLKNLAMINCSDSGSGGRIKVYGPHLLSLKLTETVWDHEIEIFAPELKFFVVCKDAESKGFFDSALPALDRADISLTTWKLSYLNKTKADHYLNSLFQYLHSAKTLKLDDSTIKILNTMCEILEPQPSPFERLESLILPSNNSLQAKVIDYFFKTSSCKKSNIVVRYLA